MPARSQTFLQAVNQVLAAEGVHADTPGDPGGDTWYGIARASHPDIPWPPTRAQAIDILFKEYWVPEFDQIPASLAVKVFNIAVNQGPKEAVLCLQRALRSCGYVLGDYDGVLGPVTVAAVNAADPVALLGAFCSEAAGNYRVLVAANSKLTQFLNAWLNRAYGNDASE